MKKIATATLLLTLAACEVGPDYQKPETALPSEWIAAKGQKTAAQETAIEQNWWRNFNDPVLNTLIDKALQGNLDLKIAEARIAQARASRALSASQLLPQGDVSATANRQQDRLAFPGGGGGFGNLLKEPFNTFQTGFDASWEFDLFGSHRRDVEATGAALEASQASRDDLRISMLAEVARTYVDIRQYQDQLALAQSTIDSDKSAADIALQRYKVGDTAEVDVSQARAQLEQAAAQLPYYRNLLAQVEFSMDVLLGQQPGGTHGLIGAPAAVPVSSKQLLLAAPAAVIANRPDIRTAERKLASATAQQGVASAQFYPDISLTGFLGLLNTTAGDLFTAGSKSWSAGGSVLWPILSYGKLSANLDAANAQQQEAMATYRKTVIGALSDVERSVTAYTEQENFREALAKSVADNQHTNDIARERYKEGLTSFLEVLDAERTLYASQNQLAQANAQASQNLIAVYKSLGGGWK